MRIIVIGGTGVIGSAVVTELSQRHEVVPVSSKHGKHPCDIGSEKSIKNFFEHIGPFDAVVVTAGNVHFADLATMTSEKMRVGLDHKLMGQVNVVLIGSKYITGRGSFTLTSGILSNEPVRTGSGASMVNAAVEGFVIGAAIELPQIRINVVSPTIVTESLPLYGPYFPGFESVSAARTALAYSRSVEGHQTGQVYRPWI
jgi:NAD(P)-dependent dehydrogenase (short-subunit alcohol dehydrogenase family)